MKIDYDTNGNKILKIEGPDLGTKRGFRIQTNGNLPETHRLGICPETDNELLKYIRAYGTDRQKELFGI